MKTWLFRADAGANVGLGHLRRLSTLASAFEGHRILVLRTDSESLADECRAHFDEVRWLSTTATLEEEIAALPSGPLHATIADISHYGTIAQPQYVHKLFSHFQMSGKLVVIDGFTHDSLRRSMPLHCDFLVTPYLGLPLEEGDFVHLNGGEYFILDPRYRYQGYQSRSCVRHVLVSMGGADPAHLTAKLLGLLAADGYGMQWTVIVGPGFDAAHIRELQELAFRHAWLSLEKNPKDLHNLYQIADYGLVGDGLTKYELASLGVPMALIASTPAGEEANSAFETRTGCMNFGRIEGLTPAQLADFFTSSRMDLNERESQSQRGRALVDGDGAHRIARRLL